MFKCYIDQVYYRFWRQRLSATNLFVPRNLPSLGSVMWQGRLWLTASLPSSRNPCTTSSQRLLKVSFLFWLVVDSHNYFAVSFFSMCGIKINGFNGKLFHTLIDNKMYFRCFCLGKEGEYKFDNNLPLSYRVRNQMMTRSLPCWPVSNESKLCTGKYRCDLTSTGMIPQFSSRQSFFLYVKVVIIPFTVKFCC